MTTTTPPAGMRFREYKGVTYRPSSGVAMEYFLYEGHAHKTASHIIAENRQFTDDDHAPLMALKANPLEPAPPEPVVRDATWGQVHDVITKVWHSAFDFSRGEQTIDGWMGTDKATDAILRAVRGERADINHAGTVAGLRSLIEWMLGENGDFPERPESSVKPYPWYWWRNELRLRYGAVIAAAESGVMPPASARGAAVVGQTTSDRFSRRVSGALDEWMGNDKSRDAFVGIVGKIHGDHIGMLRDVVHNAIHEAVEEMGECARIKAVVLDAFDSALLAPAETRGVEK